MQIKFYFKTLVGFLAHLESNLKSLPQSKTLSGMYTIRYHLLFSHSSHSRRQTGFYAQVSALTCLYHFILKCLLKYYLHKIPCFLRCKEKSCLFSPYKSLKTNTQNSNNFQNSLFLGSALYWRTLSGFTRNSIQECVILHTQVFPSHEHYQLHSLISQPKF